jgi:hypothetical protein
MFYTIDLPKPSTTLIELVRKCTAERPINYAAQQWNSEQQPKGYNIAAGDFWTDPIITVQTLKEYQRLFTDRLVPALGAIHNVKQDNAACYPPHSDNSKRTVAINYYIETGGSNVETVVYNRLDQDECGGKIISYNDLPPVLTSSVALSGNWYVLSTKHFHSVENIETNRFMLTISILNMSFEDFAKKYNSMISII